MGILDIVGNRSLEQFDKLLAPNGRYVTVGKEDCGNWIGFPLHAGRVAWENYKAKDGKSFIMFIAQVNKKDLTTLGAMLEDGKIHIEIQKEYPIQEARQAMEDLSTLRTA